MYGGILRHTDASPPRYYSLRICEHPVSLFLSHVADERRSGRFQPLSSHNRNTRSVSSCLIFKVYLYLDRNDGPAA